MRYIRRYIILLSVALITLASCSRGARVIPRKTMTKIFVDMFMADAWLGVQDQDMLKKSDTTAFYEPIFNKYGFTLDDYLKSVDHYLNDPERFEKIVSKSTAILKARQEALEEIEVEEPEEEPVDNPFIDASSSVGKPSTLDTSTEVTPKKERQTKRNRKAGDASGDEEE